HLARLAAGGAQSHPTRTVSIAELRSVQRGSRRNPVTPRKPVGDGQHRSTQIEGLPGLARGVPGAARRPFDRSGRGNAGVIGLPKGSLATRPDVAMMTATLAVAILDGHR